MGLKLSGYTTKHASVSDEPKPNPETAAQPPLETDPATPSNPLRFSKLPVRINSGGGLFFQDPCPDDPPALNDPPAHLKGEKVGTCLDDGADVFLGPFAMDGRVVAYRMWTKTKYVVDQDVCFDLPFDTLDYRIFKADLIWRARAIWVTVHMHCYCEKMREWRRARRIWEMKLLETEWDRGNTAIFPPGTEDIDVAAAIDDLVHQINEEDREIFGRGDDSDEE